MNVQIGNGTERTEYIMLALHQSAMLSTHCLSGSRTFVISVYNTDKKLSYHAEDSASRPPQTIRCQKLDSLDCICVADSLALTSLSLTLLVRKPSVLCKTRTTAIGPFGLTQGHRFWYRSKACMRLSITV